MFPDQPAVENPELLRPLLHFTAPKGWINDPNGLVYFKGKYHLFYQHNPFGWDWGNMTWGHAVSKDLLHWEHLPEALHPDELGTMFSGSGLVDHANTAGFGKGAMICLYTAAGGTNDASKGKPFTQCLAWSKDGLNLTKLASNPVVPHIAGENRDPKVFWHGPSKSWVMALYLEGSEFAILRSPDLKAWEVASKVTIPGSSECPDLFELPLDGKPGETRWVFWGADGRHLIGGFDGFKFVAEGGVRESYFGNTAYAAQTYSDAPKGRRIQISWLRGSEFRGCPFNQQLGLPHVITMKSTPQGPSLRFWPISELKKLRGQPVDGSEASRAAAIQAMDVEGSWTVPASGTLRLSIKGIDIEFDAQTKEFKVLGRSVKVAGPKLSLRAVVDRASIEIFLDDGAILMPFHLDPRRPQTSQVTLDAPGFRGKLKVYELRNPGS